MPIYLRKFYIRKLSEYKKKENEEIKRAQKKKSPTIAKKYIEFSITAIKM